MSCPHCPRAGAGCRGFQINRLCELVDPEHIDFNPSYRELLAPDVTEVSEITARPGREFESIPLAESLRLTAQSKRCLFRSKPACHCEGAAACALKGGADVSARTCWDCVRRFGA